MTEMIGEVLAEGIKVYGRTRAEEARYAYLSNGRDASTGPVKAPAPKSQEYTVPNLELQNYVKRTEVDGEEEYVLVTEHSEHLEKKYVPPPPPSAEELAAAREQKRFMTKIYAGVASVALVVMGVVAVSERRKQPRVYTQIEE